MGLLLRRDSDFLAGGERDRLSNLDALFGSGSFWSKRDLFAVRLSVSSIVVKCRRYHIRVEDKFGRKDVLMKRRNKFQPHQRPKATEIP
jgi:hypothetical protein